MLTADELAAQLVEVIRHWSKSGYALFSPSNRKYYKVDSDSVSNDGNKVRFATGDEFDQDAWDLVYGNVAHPIVQPNVTCPGKKTLWLSRSLLVIKEAFISQ